MFLYLPSWMGRISSLEWSANHPRALTQRPPTHPTVFASSLFALRLTPIPIFIALHQFHSTVPRFFTPWYKAGFDRPRSYVLRHTALVSSTLCRRVRTLRFTNQGSPSSALRPTATSGINRQLRRSRRTPKASASTMTRYRPPRPPSSRRTSPYRCLARHLTSASQRHTVCRRTTVTTSLRPWGTSARSSVSQLHPDHLFSTATRDRRAVTFAIGAV